MWLWNLSCCSLIIILLYIDLFQTCIVYHTIIAHIGAVWLHWSSTCIFFIIVERKKSLIMYWLMHSTYNKRCVNILRGLIVIPKRFSCGTKRSLVIWAIWRAVVWFRYNGRYLFCDNSIVSFPALIFRTSLRNDMSTYKDIKPDMT